MTVKTSRWAVHGAVTASLLSLAGLTASPAEAAFRIEGQVQAGGGGVANSTVTLWAGSAGEPKQLAQAKTADDGGFALSADATPGPGVSLYLIAKGGSRRGQQGRRRQSGARVSGGAGRQRPGEGRRQRDDDRRLGLDQRAVPRRRGDQGASAEPKHRRRQRAEFRRSRKPADGARPFRTRSTAARRRRWPISPRWPMRSRAARRGSRPSPATCCSRRPSRRRATRRPTR